jgi:hypothetical protein
VIRALAALALLTASSFSLAATSSSAVKGAEKAASADVLESGSPWWEKVTVTIAGDGQTQSCRWESSLQPDNAQDCEVAGVKAAATGKSSHLGSEQYTRITFERRFSPGAAPGADKLAVGDMLLGRQDMALAIDAKGAVKHCRIVAASGEMTPDYGCAEAQAERFQTSAGTATANEAPPREGTMTILVYGHAEHMV